MLRYKYTQPIPTSISFKMNFIAFTVVASVFLSAALAKIHHARTDLPGSCPKHVRHVTNPDLALLQGSWYTQFISHTDHHWGCETSCWNMFATQITDHELLINLCCQKNGKPYCRTGIGNGIISECRPGHFDLSDRKHPHVHGLILDANYDHEDGYWIGYVCVENADGPATNLIFTYSRNPVPPQGFDEFVIDTYESSNIDASSAVRIKQHQKCNYPFGCSRNSVIDWWYGKDLPVQ